MKDAPQHGGPSTTHRLDAMRLRSERHEPCVRVLQARWADLDEAHEHDHVLPCVARVHFVARRLLVEPEQQPSPSLVAELSHSLAIVLRHARRVVEDVLHEPYWVEEAQSGIPATLEITYLFYQQMRRVSGRESNVFLPTSAAHDLPR